MDRRQGARGALESVDRLINRGGDADDVLRGVVQALQERAGYGFVEIAFVEGERLEPGPAVGSVSGHAHATPIVFEGRTVGELRVEPGPSDEEERAFLERVATLVSPYCLVGWDTGGVPWVDLS